MRKTHSTLEITLMPPTSTDSRYSTDSLVKGRRVFLYGMPVHLRQTDHEFNMVPVYPYIKRLLEIVHANPESKHFRWLGGDWSVYGD